MTEWSREHHMRNHLDAFNNAIDKGVFTSHLESSTDNQYAKKNLYINDWMYMGSMTDTEVNGIKVHYDLFKNKLYRNKNAVIYQIGEKHDSN